MPIDVIVYKVTMFLSLETSLGMFLKRKTTGSMLLLLRFFGGFGDTAIASLLTLNRWGKVISSIMFVSLHFRGFIIGTIWSYLGMIGFCIPFWSRALVMVKATFGFFMKLTFKFDGLAFLYAKVFSFGIFVGLRIVLLFVLFSGLVWGFIKNHPGVKTGGSASDMGGFSFAEVKTDPLAFVTKVFSSLLSPSQLKSQDFTIFLYVVLFADSFVIWVSSVLLVSFFNSIIAVQNNK